MSPSKLRLSLALLGCLVPATAAAGRDRDAAAQTIPELEESLQGGGELAADADWKALLTLWQEAAAVASGERGAYPFDQQGKEALLAKLEASSATLQALHGRGLLNAPEAGLLDADVGTLMVAVQAKRASELELATCYRPMMVSPARDSAERLGSRLPLLEQLAASQVLHPEVVERVLVQVEADIAGVLTPGAGYPIQPDELAQARTTAERAQAQVATIRAKLEQIP